MLDLQYGLPVQVRDQALALQAEMMPRSDAGREFALRQMEDNGELDNEDKFTKAPAANNELLARLGRTQPYYERNKARVCSFWLKGACTRGAECPYRHEIPANLDPELQNQSYHARYYGVNDTVANKMLGKVGSEPTLTPPADPNITTLFVGGVPETVSDSDLRDVFYSFGELESVRVISHRHCAFVTYATRQGAERAAQGLAGRLVVKGTKLSLRWGRPAAQRSDEQQGAAGAPGTSVDPAKAVGGIATAGMQPGGARSRPIPERGFLLAADVLGKPQAPGRCIPPWTPPSSAPPRGGTGQGGRGLCRCPCTRRLRRGCSRPTDRGVRKGRRGPSLLQATHPRRQRSNTVFIAW